MRHASLVLLTLILTATFAQAQDVPKRKSGLWELKRTTTRTGDKTRVYQMCVDQASDDALRQLAEGMRNERCKSDKVSRDGNTITVDAVCQLGHTDTTAKTHAVITGSFDSAYKVESKSTFDPPMSGKKEGSAVLEAKWTGPCKPDQRPGDVILPNGVKVGTDPEGGPAETGREKRSTSGTKEKSGSGYIPVPTKPATK